MTRAFWWLHGLAWLAYCVNGYLTVLPTLAAGQYGPMLAAKTIRTAIGCGLSALLYAAIHRLRAANPPLPLLLAAVTASAAVLGVVWLSLYWLSSAPIRGDVLPPADWSRFPAVVLDYAFLLFVFSLASLGIQEWAARRDAQHRATTAELAAREAELQMLRYQLNPHFLFNALNSIRAMMPTRPRAMAWMRSPGSCATHCRRRRCRSCASNRRWRRPFDTGRGLSLRSLQAQAKAPAQPRGGALAAHSTPTCPRTEELRIVTPCPSVLAHAGRKMTMVSGLSGLSPNA